MKKYLQRAVPYYDKPFDDSELTTAEVQILKDLHILTQRPVTYFMSLAIKDWIRNESKNKNGRFYKSLKGIRGEK